MKRITIIIPALNEAVTIRDVIQGVRMACADLGSLSVIVVDDGSHDTTADLARECGARVVSHRTRRGLGDALRTGLQEALTTCPDYVFHIDADGQFRPEDIGRLLRPLETGEADCVTASRFVDPSAEIAMPRMKRWGNRWMARIVSRLCGQRFHDVSCGFRGYTVDAVLRLVTHGRFTYTQETILNLVYDGMKIVEVPCTVRGEREHGRSRMADNLFRYGWRTMQIIVRTVRDHYPMRFFGAISLVFFLIAAGGVGYLLYRYVSYGHFGAHRWLAFSVMASVTISAVAFTMGLLADMLARHKALLHESLYRLRRIEMNGGPRKHAHEAEVHYEKEERPMPLTDELQIEESGTFTRDFEPSESSTR